ncbi:MAG: response regulator [Chloroflexi bacterium]|nr:response regulator [Chloroflexota bacterium]
MSDPKTILIIDDDVKFSIGLSAVIRRAGFKVLNANNGVSGLQVIREKIPDIILCDIMMPPPNGIEVKKELANDPRTGSIPFLFLTARTAPMDKLSGLENGADDYITKPFDVNELLARIHSVLRREELGRQKGILETTKNMDQLRRSISTNLSHEMRTPLAILISTLDLVVRQKFTESNEDLDFYIKTANNSAYRLKLLVEDLEWLYQIDQGKINIIRQDIDLNFHLLIPIEQMCKIWENKHLTLDLNVDPEVIITAPRGEFIHVVSHLVDNACKFSPENGTITIAVKPNGIGGCILEVNDQGFGIPEELREKVFERYFQVSQGIARQYGGLGLGLTIARAFSQAMGGTVKIVDCETGCKVQLILPPEGSE